MRHMTPVAAALLILAAALPVSIAATNVALALLTGALLTRSRRGGTRRMVEAWKRNPAVWGMAVYAAVGLVATCFGVDPSRSLHDNAKDFHKLWVLLAFLAAFAEEPVEDAWTAMSAGLAVVVAVGLGQTVLSVLRHEPGYPLPRPHGFVHPVAYGEMLTLGFIGGVCALLRPAEFRHKPALRRGGLALMTLIAVLLAFNQTRSSVFALGAGCLAIWILEPSARRFGPWAAVVLLAIATAWELLPTGDRRSLFRLLVDFNPRDSQNVRYVLWSVACRMFRDHPLTGVGPANYGTLFMTYFDGALDNQKGWSSAHNLYLHQLAERGALGAAGLAAALGTLIVGAWRAAARSAHARALWAAAAFSSFLVMNLTEVAFQNEQVTTLLLFIWAWGVSAPGERA